MAYSITTANIGSMPSPSITVQSNTSTGINWNVPYTVNTTGDYILTTSNIHPTLQVNGDANFDGDLKIQGKSIAESLEKIEEKLAIFKPNLELEEKWENLRGLRRAYMELEAEIKEKEQIWATLKK